jgi:rSAM/selenodomain-associated transferase 2
VSFSVIIPALNEAEHIASCVRHVQELARCDGSRAEVIVADGGSQDRTAELAWEAGARVVAAPRGRGPQCNAGAAVANGAIFVFLHADTVLPEGAFFLLSGELAMPTVRAGTFRLRFDEPHWLFRIYAAFSRLDSVFTTFGDQCIVVRRELFEQVGGFPEWPLFEDVAFLQAVRRATRVRSFPSAVTTSARRFHREGVLRQSLRNGWYVLQYLMGASPQELAAKYEKSRPR